MAYNNSHIVYHLGKLVGVAGGVLVDFGTMPIAGLALGAIFDAIVYRLSAGSFRSHPFQGVVVTIGGATACAYLVFFLHQTALIDDRGRLLFGGIADALAIVVPAVDAVGRAAQSVAPHATAEAARAAFAVGWSVAAALMAVLFVIGVFPAHHRICEIIIALYPRYKLRTIASLLTFSPSLFYGVVSPYPYRFLSLRNYLLFTSNETHSSATFSVISLPSTALPLSVYTFVLGVTLLRSTWTKE